MKLVREKFRKVSRRFSQVVQDPYFAGNYLLGRVIPFAFRAIHLRKARASGFTRKFLILSFDCDTEKDIEVVEEVHDKLALMGIVPSYAVPGELLIKGKDVYKRLASKGAEFINHGFLSHTDYAERSRSYLSTVFYHNMSEQEVRNDIIQGHNVCIELFGKPPRGFRTPHFGTYQSSKQLKHLYSILNELGYSYSSSTTPTTGMWHGPVWKVSDSLLEFPVSGSYDYPGRILDSWSYRFSPTRTLTKKNYVEQFKKIVNFYADPSSVGVLNIYADPSQVYDWPEFFECIAMACKFKNVSFSQLVDEVCL